MKVLLEEGFRFYSPGAAKTTGSVSAGQQGLRKDTEPSFEHT